MSRWYGNQKRPFLRPHEAVVRFWVSRIGRAGDNDGVGNADNGGSGEQYADGRTAASAKERERTQIDNITKALQAINDILDGPVLWEDDERELYAFERYLRRLKERCKEWTEARDA